MRTAADIINDARSLALEYKALTGKPLGVTGEVAEFEAADKLGLELAGAREAGFDAVRAGPEGSERVQIKGRAVDFSQPKGKLGRVPSVNFSHPFERIVLVLL